MPTQLPARIEGATLPDTTIYWQEDGVFLDLSGYASWQIESRNCSSGADGWTPAKTTGITSAAGSATVPNVTVVWTALDLGALTAGTYDLELTGTLGGKLRKHTLRISITAEQS